MKNNKFRGVKNIVACFLLFSVFLTSSMVVLAGAENRQLSGEITFSADQAGDNAVMLNGEGIVSGRTFFSTGLISTSEKTGATVNLGKLGYLTLAPNTILNLQLSENKIGGTVSAGKVRVFNSENVAVNIETVGNAAVKSGRQSDDDDDDNDVLIPTLVFAGIVGIAVIFVLTNGDDDGASPVR